MFNSTWECNPLVLREAIGYGKSIIAGISSQYKDMFTPYIEDIEPNFIKEQLKNLIKILLNIGFQQIHLFICKNHVNLYKKIMKKKTNEYILSNTTTFCWTTFIEITGASK
jgi:hypothetical protein